MSFASAWASTTGTPSPSDADRLGIDGAELRRHRWFEMHPRTLSLIQSCRHGISARTVGVYGNQGDVSVKKRTIGVYGGHGQDKRRRQNCQGFTTEQRRRAMGIDWMTGHELSQAIPPAYTQHIGTQLLASLKAAA
jgi:DNA (cytosine-5)-methyltransferase 1